MEINNKNILTFLIYSLLFISCKKEITERDIIKDFTYNIYNESGLIGLEKLKVTKNKKERVDSIIRYSKEMIIQDTVVNKYNVSSLGFSDKNSNYYLDISKDSCYQIVDEYIICFKGAAVSSSAAATLLAFARFAPFSAPPFLVSACCCIALS